MGRVGQIICPLTINELQIELSARFQEREGKPTMEILDGALGSRIMRADRGQALVAVWRQARAFQGQAGPAWRARGHSVSGELIVESGG